jgi:hypothetical protein
VRLKLAKYASTIITHLGRYGGWQENGSVIGGSAVQITEAAVAQDTRLVVVFERRALDLLWRL